MSVPPNWPALERLGGAAPGYVGDRAAVQLWWPATGLTVSRVRGHVDAAAARFLANAIRAHYAATDVRGVGFHEWSGATDYDGEARVLLMDLTREISPRSGGVHILVSSPLVAFGVRAASAVLRNVRTYHVRNDFESALASALQERVDSVSSAG